MSSREGGTYGEQVLRLALRPKWMGLLAVALLIATAFAFLGNWQLNRSRQNATPTKIASPKPIGDVLKPQQALPPEAGTTPVEITGTLRGDQAIVVDGRRNRGEPVRWLVAPVYVSNARLPVVLGAFPETGTTPTLARRQVSFTAMLQPSEEPAPPIKDGDAAAVSSADLVARWGTPMYAGFVFADAPTARSLKLTPISAPKPAVDTGYSVLNLSYALQWWLFAAVAGFLWWRLLRDAYRDEQDKSEVAPQSVPEPDRSPTS